MSGQTASALGDVTSVHLPSMEGRTIVRPDCYVGAIRLSREYPFNGGPDNCPARPSIVLTVFLTLRWPSMEGRTIVRPDDGISSTLRYPTISFNGGPDNCPARLVGPDAVGDWEDALQWRAGQLSGQTQSCTPCAVKICPLQWRAGQLSGQTIGSEGAYAFQ